MSSLSFWEKRRNAAIMAELIAHRDRVSKMTAAEARAEMMKMGMHNEDGTLKREWGGE